MKLKTHISILLIFFSAAFFAQADKMPRFTLRATCSIPKNITSQLYRHSFGGIYDLGFSANYRLKSNVTTGFGYQSALFGLQKYFKDKFTGSNWLATRMQTHQGFVRIGYDKGYSEKKGFYTLALNTGYSINKYTGVVAPHDTLQNLYPHEYQCAFFRPEISFNFFGEGLENLAFNITIGYNYYLYFYDDKLNSLNYYKDSAFKKETKDGKKVDYSNGAGMSWLSFGFGFIYGIGKTNK